MSTTNSKLRAGDWVEVKSAREIQETLDAEGTLHGLPFMPEMLEYCGRRFHVLRRVEKTCVEGRGCSYTFQEFPQNDVVLLDGLRCSGANHGGCQRVCMLFWKTHWLRKVSSGASGLQRAPAECQEGIRDLKTMVETGRYFCQSTELVRATRSIPRGLRLLKCYRDVRDGNVGLWSMMRMIFVPVWRKMTARFRRPLVGALKRTPIHQLALQPGEEVVVKSRDQIMKTLDVRGRNRGLAFDSVLCGYSGRRFRVRTRLERMILEASGEMQKLEATVILEGANCLCKNTIGGCPRQDPVFWREAWLDRVVKTDLKID